MSNSSGNDMDVRSVVRGAAFAPSLAILFALVVIWAATGAGYFWPMWAALGLAIPTALWQAVRFAWLRPKGGTRWYVLQAGVSVVLVATCLAVSTAGRYGSTSTETPRRIRSVAPPRNASVASTSR